MNCYYIAGQTAETHHI